jgi:L-alanine-DL-glutamate epimerase-like enolase superfamily enzyme
MITRRSFIGGAGLTATGLAIAPSKILQAAPAAKTQLGQVKITDVKTAAIDIKYKTHLVKVTTDSGLYGLGEAYPKAEVADDIQDVKKVIIGEDPLHVERLHQTMTAKFMSRGARAGGLAGAIGGIETALLDLAGKILNIPVYILLGGAYRDKVMLYLDSDNPKDHDPVAWAEQAVKSRDLGFHAIKFSLPGFTSDKWNGTISSDTRRKWTGILEHSRAALGPDFPLGIDLHWKYQSGDVLEFTKMIEDLNIWYLEDPIQPENADAFARLTAESRVPILTGENLYTRQGFRPFIERQACDIVHIYPQKSGGLLETKKIADWADLYSMPMFCHNGATPVGTIASAHACMAIKSFIALETDSLEKVPYWQDIIQRDGPMYKDGYLEVPNKPGLGVELNEDVCRAHLADPDVTGFFE